MKKLTTALGITSAYLVTASTALAQSNFMARKPVEVNGPNDIQSLIDLAVKLFFIVGGVAVVIMLLWGAVEWILSGGNKDKIDAARKKIVNALIGLAILALAFLIANIVGGAIGFNPFRTPNININNSPIPTVN